MKSYCFFLFTEQISNFQSNTNSLSSLSTIGHWMVKFLELSCNYTAENYWSTATATHTNDIRLINLILISDRCVCVCVCGIWYLLHHHWNYKFLNHILLQHLQASIFIIQLWGFFTHFATLIEAMNNSLISTFYAWKYKNTKNIKIFIQMEFWEKEIELAKSLFIDWLYYNKHTHNTEV